MSKITAYTALTTADPVNDPMIIVDVSDTTQDATGTTKKITPANVQAAITSATVSDIAPNGAQALGSAGRNADARHVHPAGSWMPSDNGLLAANIPAWAGGGSFVITIAGDLYVLKIPIRAPFTATNLQVRCSTLGSGASTQSFAGLWSSSGTLLTGSADIGSNFVSPATVGVKTLPLTTPQALTPAMGFVWAGFVFNLATTQPQLTTGPGGSAQGPGMANANLTAATAACGLAGTAVTSLASFTPSTAISITAAAVTLYWVGIT